MANYIIIAKQTNGGWEARILDRGLVGTAFDSLVEACETALSELPFGYCNGECDVLSDVEYFIKADELNGDTERLMRCIGFRKCDVCGKWVTPQDCRNGSSVYANGERKCARCLELEQARRGRKLTKHGYHSTSHLCRVINGRGEDFTLDNVLGVGIEMEYNSGRRGSDEIDCTEEFYRLASPNSRHRVFRVEADCTVEGEIISNVFTKKALYEFDWNGLTDQLRLLRNDESIANVGFHTHLSKGFLGDTAKEQALNFLKLQYFLKSYEEDFFKMSGRKRNEMEWCGFYSESQIETMKRNIIDCDDGQDPWDLMPNSHSYALISSDRTIELRIGKSTNDPKKIEMYLKFVLGIVENIKNVPFKKCYCIGKVTRLVPDDVMAYWRSKGCFLHTNAMETRGVTL